MNESVAELLIRLELHLLDPQVRRDPAEVGALLADSFVEFGSSGRVYTKGEVVAALRVEVPRAIVAVDVTAKELAPNVALVTYRAIEGDSETRRSSTWVRNTDRWRMVFHQGTKVLPA